MAGYRCEQKTLRDIRVGNTIMDANSGWIDFYAASMAGGGGGMEGLRQLPRFVYADVTVIATIFEISRTGEKEVLLDFSWLLRTGLIYAGICLVIPCYTGYGVLVFTCG